MEIFVATVVVTLFIIEYLTLDWVLHDRDLFIDKEASTIMAFKEMVEKKTLDH
jgi:hypothetical protein